MEKVKSEIANLYDERAEEFKAKELVVIDGEYRVPERKSAYYFVKRKVDAAMRLSGAQRSANLLEVGCSLGQMTVLLASRFDSVVAVDLSPNCIEMCGEKFAKYNINNVRFVVDDAETLDSIEKNGFDAAFSFSAIRYCSDVQKAVTAIYDRLTPGGVAVIDFPNKYSPWHTLVKKSIGLENHINDHLFTRPDVRRMFENAGFKDVKMVNMLFIPRALPDRYVPVFKVVNEILERIPLLNRLSGVIMAVGTKHA